MRKESDNNRLMVPAACGMCGVIADLRDSHLLPAALFKFLRSPSEKNPNPVAVRPGVAIASSDQVRKPFLCSTCEHRLDVGGERWMIANCYQADGKFPLYDSIIAQPARLVFPRFSLYPSRGVPGIEPEQLGYFAASILWRASATNWRNKRSPRIEVGPHQDSLRRYLLGLTPFPENAALRVILPTPTRAKLVLTLPVPGRLDGIRCFTFIIPGIAFTMFFGKHIPSATSEVTFMPSAERMICISDQIYRECWEPFATALGTAEPKGYLKSLQKPG